MSEFKVGDTVDPRTLPVGARFRSCIGTDWVVTGLGWARVDQPGTYEVQCSGDDVTLLSLPSDPVELGTLAAGDHFEFAACELYGTDGVPKSQPCKACGAEGLHLCDASPALKPGDTVDPRTLPVGAEFRYERSQWAHRVIQAGAVSELIETGQRRQFGCDTAILLSLTSSSSPLWDHYGVPLKKQPNCHVCGDDEIGSHFDSAWCHRCGWNGSLTALLSRVAPEPKRPPCDACGEESLASADGLPHTHVDRQPAFLCRNCFCHRRSEDVDRDVRARRAQQPIATVASLPTYDQIAGWLGAEWVVRDADWQPFSFAMKWAERDPGVAPFPWWRAAGGQWRCYLRHTSGQRVEVTAPSSVLSVEFWAFWFGRIRSLHWHVTNNDERYQLYSKHVRWLDPDTKTITGSESATRNAAEAASAAPEKPEPVVPEGLRCPFCTSRSHSFGFMNPDGTGARAIICDECDYRAPDSDWFGQPSCSSCSQPFWAGRKEVEWEHGPALCGDCLTQGHYEPADHLTNDLDTRIAEVAEPEVRIEDMPGAWQSSSWEDVS